jgi:hypothetical protein
MRSWRRTASGRCARWPSGFYYLLVQRDAAGPNDYDEIFRIYGIPREVRLLLGTRDVVLGIRQRA